MNALVESIKDLIKFMQKNNTGCSKDFFSVTPNDGADLPKTIRSLQVGADGTLAVKNASDVTVTFNVLKGQILPIYTKRVMATGTTTTGIVALV